MNIFKSNCFGAALASFIWLCSPSAIADIGGDNLNTTTFSTKTDYIVYDATATQRIDTYAIHLIANLDGGPTLFDQTLVGTLGDPAAQAAIISAKNLLTTESLLAGWNSISFSGPSLIDLTQTLLSSDTGLPQDNVTAQFVMTTVTFYIGPQTIHYGDFGGCTIDVLSSTYGLDLLQSLALLDAAHTSCTYSLGGTPFDILAGGTDFDILTTTDIFLDRTITTTDTYLNTLTYQIVGHVPEPASLSLLSLGGLMLAWRRQRSRLADVRKPHIL